MVLRPKRPFIVLCFLSLFDDVIDACPIVITAKVPDVISKSLTNVFSCQAASALRAGF